MSRMRVTEQLLGPPEYEVEDVRGGKAAKLYEMWHKKKPNGAHVMTYEFPEALCSIGTAHNIRYHSDKWEQDGNGYDYDHDFESSPKVYAPSDSPYFARSNPVVSTSKIIHADIDGDVPLPMLAVVREFSFKDVRGDHKTMEFSSNPPLLCMTQDAKCLIMFATIDGVETPLFVRGGEMYVSARGIII